MFVRIEQYRGCGRGERASQREPRIVQRCTRVMRRLATLSSARISSVRSKDRQR